MKTITANAVSYQTALDRLPLSANKLKAYSKAGNLVVEFELTEPSDVKIEIFSIQGVRLAVYNQNFDSGLHSILEIQKPVAGHYIAKLTSTKGISSTRFVVYLIVKKNKPNKFQSENKNAPGYPPEHFCI